MTLETGKYQHYKGGMYEVIGTARHSETLEEMVIYKALDSNDVNNVWVRPLKMFTEKININGKWIFRFSLV